jgi:hypothetical protein
MSDFTDDLSATGPDLKDFKDYREAVVEGKTTLEMAEAHA